MEMCMRGGGLTSCARAVCCVCAGSGMSREDSIPVIEALAGADTSTTAFLTIHNMAAWCVRG